MKTEHKCQRCNIKITTKNIAKCCNCHSIIKKPNFFCNHISCIQGSPLQRDYTQVFKNEGIDAKGMFYFMCDNCDKGLNERENKEKYIILSLIFERETKLDNYVME